MSLFLAFALLRSCAARPLPPTWPSVWSATWTEHVSSFFTKGSSVYNATSNSLLWRRADSSGDAVCTESLNLSAPTECQHLVVSGKRFVHFPVLAECCYCCAEEDGCGLLQPDFLSRATFAGSQTYYGESVYVWETPTYTYYETQSEAPESRAWVALFSEGANYAYVTGWTQDAKSYDLVLPNACKDAQLCDGPCNAIRQTADKEAKHALVALALRDHFGIVHLQRINENS